MAKYMAIASYTAEGMKALTAGGGSARVEASRAIVAEAGGTLESFYFAFGKDDVYVVCDLPDNVAAAAVAMAVAASGLVVTRMVTLLTPQEIDQAAARKLPFQAPGG
jgi:uncharacterized protein with GYD domain